MQFWGWKDGFKKHTASSWLLHFPGGNSDQVQIMKYSRIRCRFWWAWRLEFAWFPVFCKLLASTTLAAFVAAVSLISCDGECAFQYLCISWPVTDTRQHVMLLNRVWWPCSVYHRDRSKGELCTETIFTPFERQISGTSLQHVADEGRLAGPCFMNECSNGPIHAVPVLLEGWRHLRRAEAALLKRATFKHNSDSEHLMELVLASKVEGCTSKPDILLPLWEVQWEYHIYSAAKYVSENWWLCSEVMASTRTTTPYSQPAVPEERTLCW